MSILMRIRDGNRYKGKSSIFPALLLLVLIPPIIGRRCHSAYQEDLPNSNSGGSDKSLSDFGESDCRNPDVKCDIFSGRNSPPPNLPCINELKLLRHAEGQIKYLRHEDLLKHALEKVLPEWPADTPPGYQANIYVVIGIEGRVLCADILGQEVAPKRAALAAALKWRFMPIIEKGSPISAIGLLSFETPIRRKYIQSTDHAR